MHFVMNRASSGSEHTIKMNRLTARRQTTTTTKEDDVPGPKPLSADLPDLSETAAVPVSPLLAPAKTKKAPLRGVDRRLPKAVRARLKRSCSQFGDASQSVLEQWHDQHSSSRGSQRLGCKRRRIVVFDDEEQMESDSTEAETVAMSEAFSNSNSTQKRPSSPAASEKEQDKPSSTNTETTKVGAAVVEEEELEDNAARVVTPVPSETSDSEVEATEESSDEEEQSSAVTKLKRTTQKLFSELLHRVSTLRISRARKNRYPADFQFADAVEELEEDDEDEDNSSVGSGTGQEPAVNKKYPGADTPLCILFQSRAPDEEEEEEESLSEEETDKTTEKASTDRTSAALEKQPSEIQNIEVIDLISLSSEEEEEESSVDCSVVRNSIEPIPTEVRTTTLRSQQQLRRVSQSPTRESIGDKEDDPIELEYEFSNETSPVGRCERISKDPTKEPLTNHSHNNLPPFSLNMFQDLWQSAEDIIGFNTETIEYSNEFRRANNKLKANVSTEQNKAMYGRILPGAMDKIFREMLCIKKNQVFADFGHGIGNACLQASYTIGCESKGIELVSARYFVSEALNRSMSEATRVEGLMNPKFQKHAAGHVELKQGKIEDPLQREWLTDVDAVFVNNFNEVFGRRSTYATQRTIDDYIAALFAKMKPGAVMVTMEPIYSLDQTLSEANSERKRHDLKMSTNASFYEVEELELGLACESVSWSEGEAISKHEKIISVHKYTRVEQENGAHGAGVFLCTNPTCDHAVDAIPIPAAVEDENARLVLNYCPKCKSSGRRKRRKNNTPVRYR